MKQVFNAKQEHYIAQGASKQTQLRAIISEAFLNNTFNDNFVIASLPGLGKSFEAESAISQTTDTCLISGTSSMAFFTVQVATAVFMAQGNPVTIVLDDCDVLFEDKSLNTAKKMFDQTKVLQYNKMASGLKSQCSELQWAAIESFSCEEKPGFEIPLNNVTFIILTNRLLPTSNYVGALEEGTKKHSVATDLLAIRRRVEYNPIEMETLELWGYIANVTLNERICEKFNPEIKPESKEQIVNWLFANWDRVTERNLSVVEKMTKDMVRFETNYLDIWEDRYVEV